MKQLSKAREAATERHTRTLMPSICCSASSALAWMSTYLRSTPAQAYAITAIEFRTGLCESAAKVQRSSSGKRLELDPYRPLRITPALPPLPR